MKISRLAIVLMISAPVGSVSIDNILLTGAKAIAGTAPHLLMNTSVVYAQQRPSFLTRSLRLPVNREALYKVKRTVKPWWQRNACKPDVVITTLGK